jgi:tRNA pseudouridine55 synthase
VPSRLAEGVLVLDKPRGPTSHDVVARMRRALRTRAIGHAGTLDPMATGVLVVAVGEATKLVPWLTAHDKAYEATIALGVETDTLDAMGREVRRVPPAEFLLAALGKGNGKGEGEGEGVLESSPLREAFEAERARTLQTPPVFSAIREGGERAFDRARRGEAFELTARPVVVRALGLLGCTADPPSLRVWLEVGKGYYVRSLARDLAQALGTVGHLTSLRRTRSGGFTLEEALPLDAAPETLHAALQPLARAAARALPAVHLTEAGARDAGHGRSVAASDASRPEGLEPGAPCAWLAPTGDLVAVGQWAEDGRGRVLRGFRSA